VLIFLPKPILIKLAQLFMSNKMRHFFSKRNTPRQQSPIILDRQHICIIPTKAGFGFVLALFIMLLGSMNYNNNMGYALTFLLASMALVSVLHTHRTLLGLRIELGKIAPVFLGEIAQFNLWLDNRGKAARYALMWEYGKQSEQEQIIMDIVANQRVSLNIPIITKRRGRIFLGRIKVHSCFPLGLFYAWSNIYLDASTLVYPQPLGNRNLPLGQLLENTGEGSPHDSGGDDFIGYRDYKEGDSPRHIDWKAVARGQAWMIKKFGGLSNTSVWLTWDDVSMLNNVEAALSQLCLWILLADSQGAEYGLKIPKCTLEPNSGELHRELCLQALALYNLPLG
jgi:uncharacterized protein (DUF58 family)